jgi:aldose 1-epimerase
VTHSTGRQDSSSVSREPFGSLPDGRKVSLFTLSNRAGMQVKLSNYGGIITALRVPSRDGQLGDVVLGFDSLAPYLHCNAYFGALIGRYGNRIAGGRCVVDGQAVQLDRNDRGNHLHGGSAGFDKRLWDAQEIRSDSASGVALRYRSVDGEQGYPGNLDVTVRYLLDQHNTLHVDYHAVTDRATPVNLTQHSYFNLAGSGDVLGHELAIAADGYTPVVAGLIPLGHIEPVAGTPFDFRSPRAIGEQVNASHPQLQLAGGYDHNFALCPEATGGPRAAVRVHDPVSGRVLRLYTTEPGLQFYSGNFLDGSLAGKGRTYGHRSGFCIEPQHFPDAPNQAAFANTILYPGQQYRSASRYVFSTDRDSA